MPNLSLSFNLRSGSLVPVVAVPPACSDAAAGVLMTGSNAIWNYGPRFLTQLVPGYNPWGTGWTYSYGDEVVRNLDGVWIYENVNPQNPLGEIARSYSPVAWPWLATWPNFTATKFCPPPTYAGLSGKRYVGYFNDDVNWFDTANLHGAVNQLTQISDFSSEDEGYSWQWLGYFKASTTENYTFYTKSDDASYVWIGNNAINGFTTANANVNNGTEHPERRVDSTPVSLVAGTYYPIRVQFGEQGGGDIMSLGFSTPTIPETTDGSGYYYSDFNTPPPPPPPSGIPVASTESVLIATSTFSYTFPKDPGQDSYVFLLNCVEEGGCEVNLRLEYPNRNGNGMPWQLYDHQNSLLVSTNTSSDLTTIPTTGWTPSITITAA